MIAKRIKAKILYLILIYKNLSFILFQMLLNHFYIMLLYQKKQNCNITDEFVIQKKVFFLVSHDPDRHNFNLGVTTMSPISDVSRGTKLVTLDHPS